MYTLLSNPIFHFLAQRRGSLSNFACFFARIILNLGRAIQDIVIFFKIVDLHCCA